MRVLITGLFFVLITSCQSFSKDSPTVTTAEKPTPKKKSKPHRPVNNLLTKEFKNYWFRGKAEINSYTLQQERYGSIREAQSVLIFVTEPFLESKQVKADKPSDDATQVLKMNKSTKFLTGVYPYSLMTSVFSPLKNPTTAYKASFTAQEWCGHVFAQLNRKELTEVQSRSYFESESDENEVQNYSLWEDELWNLVRIQPETLPTGNLEIVPSLDYCRLRHKKIKAYNGMGTLEKKDSVSIYTLTYPELDRSLRISFSNDFPHTLLGWVESVNGVNSTAYLKKTIMLDYWAKNRPGDEIWRDSLGLK